MKDIITVMKFTMKDLITKKSFIISTIIILVLIVIGFNVPKIIKNIMGEEKNPKLAIVDKDNIFKGELKALESVKSDYDIMVENFSEEEAKNLVDNETIDSALVIEEKNDGIKILQ